MKYICAEDFFRQAASAKRLSREEEKEYALRMKAGDREAEQMILTESYLPVLAAYLKQHVRQPSLQLVYLGLQTLESAVSTFDF